MSIDQQLLNDLQVLRTQTRQFFDEQRLTARKTINVRTSITTARLLAYSYYGESILGAELAKLNNTLNVSNILGDVDILTE